MGTSGKIIDLRKLLAERFPQPPIALSGRLATGVASLDSMLQGGLPQGAITELTSPQRSAGTASFTCSLLQTAQRHRYFIALLDGSDSFDPGPLGNLCLRHLLWVRCQKALEVIKAADLLLRDGNFPLVIADLVFNPIDELRKIPQTSWYRLQRLVEPRSTAFLVLMRRSMVNSAQLKIVLENTWTLQNLEQQNPLRGVRWRLQRSHIHDSAIAPMQAT